MNFNPIALTFHAPGGVTFRRNNRQLFFYRQAQGLYEYHGSESGQDVCLAAGLSSPASRLCLEDAYRAGAALGYSLEPGPWVSKVPEYIQFLHAQDEFIRGVKWQQEGHQAAADFRNQVDGLLHGLSSTVLPDMKLRDLTNPVRCRALSKRRDGVFVWPSWDRPDTVHLVVSTDHDIRLAVQDQVYAWVERNKLKIALPGRF